MGCIEINKKEGDVNWRCKFNRNMGCIEIERNKVFLSFPNRFNRNMGCIEILLDNGKVTAIVKV